MIKYAVVFAIIAIIAGLFGFTGISVASAGIAKVSFFIAISVFLILLVAALFVGKKIGGGGGS